MRSVGEGGAKRWVAPGNNIRKLLALQTVDLCCDPVQRKDLLFSLSFSLFANLVLLRTFLWSSQSSSSTSSAFLPLLSLLLQSALVLLLLLGLLQVTMVTKTTREEVTAAKSRPVKICSTAASTVIANCRFDSTATLRDRCASPPSRVWPHLRPSPPRLPACMLLSGENSGKKKKSLLLT